MVVGSCANDFHFLFIQNVFILVIIDTFIYRKSTIRTKKKKKYMKKLYEINESKNRRNEIFFGFVHFEEAQSVRISICYLLHFLFLRFETHR